VTVWLGWAAAFWRHLRSPDAGTGMARLVRLLLAGSVAELLVAVPCHVYVRSKDYCCAGAVSLAGLATGWAVLLFAFGPGVFFLFLARVRRLRHGARPARPLVPRTPRVSWGPQTHDALIWAGTATAILSVAASRWAMQEKIPSGMEPALVTIAFTVMAAASLFHARKASFRNEPSHLMSALLAWYLAETILIAILWCADSAIQDRWWLGTAFSW